MAKRSYEEMMALAREKFTEELLDEVLYEMGLEAQIYVGIEEKTSSTSFKYDVMEFHQYSSTEYHWTNKIGYKSNITDGEYYSLVAEESIVYNDEDNTTKGYQTPSKPILYA